MPQQQDPVQLRTARDRRRNPRRLAVLRKLSGFNSPSQANQAAFDQAVDDVAAAATALIGALVTNADPRDREVEALRAKARNAVRFQLRE